MPECPVDPPCDNLKISGVVNITEVKNVADLDTNSILYGWHIFIENCSGEILHGFTLNLALDWLHRTSTQVVAATNDIFQEFLSELDVDDWNFEVISNIPDIAGNSAWTGHPTDTAIFTLAVDLPPGQWIAEVYAEIPRAEIDALFADAPGYLPTLFPATVTGSYVDAPSFTTTTTIGCSPKQAVAYWPAPPDDP